MGKKRLAELLMPLLLSLICIYVLVKADGFPKEPGMFPIIVATFTLALCLLSILISLVNQLLKKGAQSKEGTAKKAPKGVLLTMLSIVLYVAAILIIGYFSATILYMGAIMYLYGYRNFKTGIPVIIGMTLTVYLLFVLILKIEMPIGLIWGGELSL